MITHPLTSNLKDLRCTREQASREDHSGQIGNRTITSRAPRFSWWQRQPLLLDCNCDPNASRWQPSAENQTCRNQDGNQAPRTKHAAPRTMVVGVQGVRHGRFHRNLLRSREIHFRTRSDCSWTPQQAVHRAMRRRGS